MDAHRAAEPAPHQAVVSAVALAGDGTVLSASYDGTLALSRVAAGRLVRHGRFTLHTKGVNCIALAPGDELALTGGSDSAACLVDLRTGDVRRLEHPGDV